MSVPCSGPDCWICAMQGVLPPPAPGDPHIWLSSRGHFDNSPYDHWHGRSRLGDMECRATLREAGEWILAGGQDESW